MMKARGPRKQIAFALTLLVSTVGLAMTGGPAGAQATLACGQVVTASTILTSDVGPCAGDGLILGADGITLDLNGHRIFGTPGEGDNVGVNITDRTGVTVTGGEVTDFGAGIAIRRGSQNTVRQVFVHDNIGLLDGSGDYGDGIAIFGSPDNLLEANTVEHNGPFDGIGVFGPPSTGNRIEGNTIARNNIARLGPEPGNFLNLDDGVNLGAGLSGGSHTTVSNNVIIENGFNGINACSARGEPCYTSDNVITGNLIQDNGFGDPTRPKEQTIFGDGIHVVAIRPPGLSPSDFFPPTRNLVTNNRVFHNAGDGISVGSSNNEILDNVALRNGSAIRHFYFDAQDISLNNDCDSNVWRGNRFGTVNPRCVRGTR